MEVIEKNVSSYEKFQIIKEYTENKVSLLIISQQKNISRSTLYRWLSDYRKSGLDGLEHHQRSDKNKYRKISDELQKAIEGLALRKPKISIAAIYKQACVIAANLKEPKPSYSVIYKILKRLPEDMMVLAHNGNKEYEETFDLLYRREAVRPNAMWQADHCLLDIYVIGEDQQPVRPWLTIIIDDYSRAIAGYYFIFKSPSALQTALALRQAIWCKSDYKWEICGIPEILYTDHGSDFTSRHLEMSCADLKIDLIFSMVGKPRGRGRIERFFLTINQELLCHLPGYIAKDNPKNMTKLLTLRQLEEKFKNYLLNEYHQLPHSITKVPPIKRWGENGFLPQMPSSLEKLDLLLLTVSEPRKVHQDGIHFQTLRYIDTILAAYVGESVNIRYDPRDMAEIRVFYDNKFLCRAICQELSTETISLKDIVNARKNRKKELNDEINQRKSIVDQLLYSKNKEFTSPVAKKNAPKSKLHINKIKLYEND